MATPAFNPSQDYQAAPPAFNPNAEYAADSGATKPVQRGVVSGVVRGAKNLAAMPGQMWDALTKPPQTDEEKFLHENGIGTPQGHLPGPLALPFWRLVGKPMADAEDKADQYEQQAAAEKDPEVKKQLLDAAGAWRTGSKVALVGPVAANLAERAAYGEQGPSQVGPSGKGGWQNENQDVTGAVGEAGTYVAAPKAAEDVLRAGATGIKAIPKVAEAVRDATPKQAAQAVGGVSGGIVSAHGNTSLSPMGAYYGAKGAGALVESILGKERANSPIVARPQPFEQPAPFPANPTPEQLNPSLVSPARTLPGQVGPERIFGPRPVPAQPIPSRAGLALTGEVATPAVAQPGAAGSMVESVAAPEAASAPKPISKAALGRQLDQALPESLGVEPPKPLQPNVSLKNQIKAEVQAQAPLPDGFTRVKSDALRGYKYDPEAREFESITNDGQHYVHGDVPPEAVEKFEAADSKGRAWKTLRETPGVVRTAKVVNGQRVAATPPASIRSIVIDPETGQPEFSDVVAAKKSAAQAAPNPAATSTPATNTPKTSAAKPPASTTAAGEGDLLSQLQASVDQVKAKPGGVFTSAAPKDLLTRWGVDPESFTEGREQTRGMSPQETEASIKKLTAAYKKGQPVEPVLETRDADNNLVDVDGRGRALAAHRAGVERIPVIVRRLAPASSQ